MSKLKLEIIAHTPNIEQVLASAGRLCYSKVGVSEILEKHSKEDNERFVKMLADMGHCYDDKTEVLTSEGFKKWEDVTENDLLGAFNPSDATLNGFEKPKKLFKRYASEKLVKFNHKRASLVVTDGHRLYCSLSNSDKRRSNPKFELVEANTSIRNKMAYTLPLRMLSCSYNKNKEEKITDSLFKFYGFFIGDGYIRRDCKVPNSIEFHIRKERKVKYLKEICTYNNFQIIENANDKYRVLVGENIARFMKEMLYNNDNEKTFPNEFYSMSSNEFDCFIDGLLNSDGNYATSFKNDIYYTSSNELADKLQTLCSLNGRPVTRRKNDNNCNELYIGKERYSKPMFNDSRSNNKAELVDYEGYVYCATVSTGLLMIRRNGFTLLCGNCSPLEHVSFTFAVEGVSRALSHQLVRHRIASYSQQSQRYVSLEENFDYIIPKSIENNEFLLEQYRISMNAIHNIYKNCTKELEMDYMSSGMSKRDANKKAIEDARYILPNACETKLVFTMNVRTILHFLEKRCCMRAQWEIRELANEMLRQLKEVSPILFNNAGKPCLRGKCTEGNMACSK